MAPLGHFLGQVFPDGLQEVLGVEVHVGLDVLEAMDAACQVLGHFAGVNRVNASLLQGSGEPKKKKIRE